MDVHSLIAPHEPNGLALVCGVEQRSWAELSDRVDRLASSLVRDRQPGDVVAVLGDTSIEFVEAVLATLAAGLTVLPLHTLYPAAELDRACQLASPALLVEVDAVAGNAARAMNHPVQRVSLSGYQDDPAVPGRIAPVEHDETTPAVLLFTSGTAGSPRLAILSRANVTASIQATVGGAAPLGAIASRMAGVMPLTHVLGLVSVLGVALSLGSTLVLADASSVSATVADVAKHGVRLLVAPPIFWYRLAEADLAPDALATVEVGLSGAAPLSGSLARRVEERFGFRLRQGYGLTEATSALTTSVGTEAPAASVGRPLPGVQLRLIDEFGDDALVGDVGELLVKGPSVFSGYLGDDEATAAVLDDEGWLRTGDLAVVDEQGNLFIVGRCKDQIISAGFNVHPGEVEDLLARHPGVQAAAVVGESDREYGELVVGFVVLADAETGPSEADLIDHCRQSLAGYKVPRRIEFVQELPRTSTGKLRRRMLRAT